MASPGSSSKIMVQDTGGKILERLRAALRSDGDFPVRARVVTQLRALANSPNTKIDEITDLILREPSLGTRVLHLVNSAYFQRTAPILTVKQGVMQLGMRSLSDFCAGFVLMQKFVPAAQRGGVFAESVKRTIITALLSNKLASSSKTPNVAERGYLAGSFFHLGYLLLAFYFPQVYESAAKRAVGRGYSTSRSISEILGVSSWELSVTIVNALKIPDFYRDVLLLAHQPRKEREGNADLLELAEVLATAGRLAEAIVESRRKEDVEEAIEEIVEAGVFTKERLIALVDELVAMFPSHCALIELSFLDLPPFVKNFSQVAFREPGSEVESKAAQRQAFARYITDIQMAIDGGTPLSSVICLVMEALTDGLEFERSVLMYADSESTRLTGKLASGPEVDGIDVTALEFAIDDDDETALMQAFFSGLTQFYGDGLFLDGWPFVMIPVGSEGRVRGVVYADNIGDDSAKPLDEGIRASVLLLAELLDKSAKAWE